MFSWRRAGEAISSEVMAAKSRGRMALARTDWTRKGFVLSFKLNIRERMHCLPGLETSEVVDTQRVGACGKGGGLVPVFVVGLVVICLKDCLLYGRAQLLDVYMSE